MCALHRLYWFHIVADEDYVSGAINVTFGVGNTSTEITINITDDSIDEGSEAFKLVIKRTDDTPDLVEIVDPMNATGIIDDDPGIRVMVVQCRYTLQSLVLHTFWCNYECIHACTYSTYICIWVCLSMYVVWVKCLVQQRKQKHHQQCGWGLSVVWLISYILAEIYMLLLSQTHACIHTNTHAHTSVHTCMHVHKHTPPPPHTHMHTHMCTCARASTHAHARTDTHAHTHAHTHTHTHTHTHLKAKCQGCVFGHVFLSSRWCVAELTLMPCNFS